MAYRTLLQKQLQKRFPVLPEELLQRIARADLPSLEAAFDQLDSLPALENLRL